MAPLFIASALVSGTALMILLALIVRRTGKVGFKDDLVGYLGGMLAVFIAVEGFLVFSEMLTAAYPGAGFEADPARRLLTGPYAGFFWFEVLAGLAVPFVLLAVPRLRAKPRWVAAASVLAVAGILIHRVNIVLNGLVVRDRAVSAGRARSARRSRSARPRSRSATSTSPALIEYLVAGGVICFGALVFTLAARWLPLREGGAARAGAGS